MDKLNHKPIRMGTN